MLNINNDFIIKALEFYNINDNFYKNKCFECLEYLNSQDDFKSKFEDIYNLLYHNDDKIREFWKIKDLNILFGDNYHPFITSILILSGYEIHYQNMKKYNFDDYQINVHKKRVKETLLNDLIYRNYSSIRISQMLWGIYFIKIKVIEVGRLQYEMINFNPVDESKKQCIKIHISSGDRLDINKVKKSLQDSKSEIKKYFKINNPEYYCSSWLLSKQIRTLVNNNSNIASFFELFDILKEEDGLNDILNFIYNINNCEDYNKLPTNTSLQKNVKKMLLNNINIKIGIGKLKNNI